METIKCRNCGNKGHKLRNCKFPRLSYGIILFNKNDEIVLIEKKDSISYIEFIRGKYSVDDSDYIQLLINRMSIIEKEKIINNVFEESWNNLWYNSNNKKEYDISFEKYNTLIKNGLLKDLIKKTSKHFEYNEWEIPKGRRNINESNKECAIREFEEETNININDYNLYDNILPFEESYIGSNNIEYKNVYYIGELKNNVELIINENNENQIHEVKDIKWISKNNYKGYIRDYSDYKLKVVEDTFKFLYSDYKNNIIL
jgi:8-oxo-dGTP pyrophosphatase MutT (NUDIX family)